MDIDAEITEKLAYFYDKPYEFVMWAFPWGGKGTILENRKGLRDWQKDYLIALGEEVRKRGFDGKNPVDPIRFITASGHGIGKSMLCAVIILWIMCTRPFCRGTVTANTSDQLNSKTWAELAKWYNLFLLKDMFTYRNTRGSMVLYENAHKDTWFCKATTCKEENSEAFAGQHAENSTSFYIFDEGSAVPDKIYEVAEGGLTDGEPMQLVFGNPTRNTGTFHDAFTQYEHRWVTRSVDSRDVEGAINPKLAEEWAEDYGEDSDFFKVRVRGLFPSAGSFQLIPNHLVELAYGKFLREEEYKFSPVILGVDVARYGDDASVIVLRQGLMSKVLNVYRGMDLMTMASMVAHYEGKYNANAVFIDIGMGAGVIDRLRQLGHTPIEVAFGSRSKNPQAKNKRAEMWIAMRDWLQSGGSIPKNMDLSRELTAQEYFFQGDADTLQLVAKKDMKLISGNSPDIADALACTFAEDIATTNVEEDYYGLINKTNKCKVDFDLFN